MTKQIILSNGKELLVKPFSFTEKNTFKKMVFEIVGEKTFTDISVISDGISVLCKLLSNEKLDNFVFSCINKCTYNSILLTKDNIENNQEIHGVFTEIQIHVVKELSSFFITPLLLKFEKLGLSEEVKKTLSSLKPQ